MEQNQNSFSLLEHLSNEIFNEILSYLNGVDAVFAFSYLNNRFQCLLIKYNRMCFNFKSINKTIFDFIFRNSIVKECKSLQFSGDNDTHGQIEYFFQNYSLIHHCPQLESLSLFSMKLLNQDILLTQLCSLPNLTSLIIDQFICRKKLCKIKLPNLKKLVITSCISLKGIKVYSQLENLEYTITNTYCEPSFCMWGINSMERKCLVRPLILKRLKIVFEDSEQVKLVQKSLPALSQLIIFEIYQKEVEYSTPNGKQWEELIRSSLPLLKIFKFYFQFKFSIYSDRQLEKVVSSFSTPFYKYEKNWFIGCARLYESENSTVLYSLPFPLEQFALYRNCFPNNNDSMYVNIKTLVIDKSYILPDDNFKNSKIINLIINTHVDYFKWIYIWKKLRHLEINSNANISIQHFSFILKDTLNLCSLSADKDVLRKLTRYWNHQSICDQLSCKIRSLKLYSNHNQSILSSEKELIKIMAIFANKCEHLSLCIKSRTRTVALILQNMSQLYSLHVHFEKQITSPFTKNWLEAQRTRFNHSNCLIVNNEYDHYFWLEK